MPTKVEDLVKVSERVGMSSDGNFDFSKLNPLIVPKPQCVLVLHERPGQCPEQARWHQTVGIPYQFSLATGKWPHISFYVYIPDPDLRTAFTLLFT